MTQCERVLEHLKTYGSITPLEAQERYGIMRLGARIWDLRHENGVKIKSETKTEKNRYGEMCHFANYRLEEEQC